MESPHHPIREAIELINRFLEDTTGGTSATNADSFRELSRRIELARSSRDQHACQRARSPSFSNLCDEYRSQLERLRLRLADLEVEYRHQRTRLLKEQACIARTREWHALVTKTQ